MYRSLKSNIFQAHGIVIPQPGKDLTSTGSDILTKIEKIDKKLKLTPKQQFGFRSGHSTTHHITKIITEINQTQQNTSMMLLDIRHAESV